MSGKSISQSDRLSAVPDQYEIRRTSGMKLTVLGIAVIVVIAIGHQAVCAQAPTELKVRGCLQGNGSEQSPWTLRGVVLPPPPSAAPAGNRGGGGAGGGRGAAGGGGRGG